MNRAPRITAFAALLFLATLIALLSPGAAYCGLMAEAELGYVDYDYKDNNRHGTESSFTQRYSVMYDTSGKLVNGRLGRYNLALGYELLTFDTDKKSSVVQSENFGDTKGHLMYKGELVIDPKEVPFRLSLHRRDESRNAFSTIASNNAQIFGATESSLEAPTGNSTSAAPLNYVSIPSMTTAGITGGARIDSGATLVMGVKNGMTNGYNEFLRHFPMLLLDFRDVTNKDVGTITRVDNRLSRLAFVSLNKKDNWFHYRYVTYEDNIDSTNNYNETQIQLGTIDHLLQRRWVDFSNWLSVSVDGQLTKRMQARTEENFEEFSLNLFGIARRQSWELRNFSNFTRLNEVALDKITYMTSVPVYANGTLSPTANWSAFTKYSDSHTDKGAYFTTVSGGYSIDALRKSSFNLNHDSSAERAVTSANSEMLILNSNISAASTPLFSRNLSLKAGYGIRNYNSETNGKPSSFTDQEVYGTAIYHLSNMLRISGTQTNRLTSGSAPVLASSIPGAVINSPQYVAPRDGSTVSMSSYQSVSKFDIAWNPKPRLHAGFSVSEDIYLPSSGERTAVTSLDLTASYAANRLNLSHKTSYDTGGAYNSQYSNLLHSTNSASYTFSRSLDARVGLSYFKAFGGKDRIDAINADQSLNYYHYRVNGIERRLFEINESFSSAEELLKDSTTTESVSTKRRTNTLLLGAKYYPFRQMMIAGGARYSFVSGMESDALNYYGSLAVQFQLLEASLDYTYGKNKADNRVEKRISANVKKKF